MKFDFSIPMTSYEMLAVVLSIIAILMLFLPPFLPCFATGLFPNML